MTEVDFVAIKERIREILATDDNIFAQVQDRDKANSNRGKIGEHHYLKLRAVEVGEPDELTTLPTPYCFITNANPRERDEVAGTVVGGVVSSSIHRVRIMLVVVDQQKSRADVEISLDILHKLIKERLKSNPYLKHPVDGDDPQAKFSHPVLSENFMVDAEDRTFHGFMITLEILKQTGA